MHDDAELLRQYLTEGSEQAFGELARRYLPLIHGVALRRLNGDRHRAEDATQAVLIDLARKAPSLRGRPTLAGWVFTSARFAAANLARAENRLRVREWESTHMNESTEPAIPGNEANALIDVVESVLDHLRPRDRELILLRYFEGRTFPQIAEGVGTSADSARLKVDRALERLRLLLARRGITSTSAVLSAAMARAGTALSSEAAQSMINVAAAVGRAGGMPVTAFSVSKIVAWMMVPIAAGAWMVAAQQRGEVERLRNRPESTNPPANAVTVTASISPTPTTRVATSPASSAESVSPEETRILYDRLQKRLHTDESLLALKIEQSKENIRARYAPLIESLGLNVTQRESFFHLQGEKTKAGMRLAATRYEGDMTETDARYLALVERHRHDTLEPIERSRRDLLGSDFERVRAFEAALPAAPLAEALATSLHYSNAPLSSDQAVAFMALAQAANTSQVPGPDWSNLDSRLLLSKAGEILSEPQLSALKTLVTQSRRQTEIEQRNDEIMREVARQGAR